MCKGTTVDMKATTLARNSEDLEKTLLQKVLEKHNTICLNVLTLGIRDGNRELVKYMISTGMPCLDGKDNVLKVKLFNLSLKHTCMAELLLDLNFISLDKHIVKCFNVVEMAAITGNVNLMTALFRFIIIQTKPIEDFLGPALIFAVRNSQELVIDAVCTELCTYQSYRYQYELLTCYVGHCIIEACQKQDYNALAMLAKGSFPWSVMKQKINVALITACLKTRICLKCVSILVNQCHADVGMRLHDESTILMLVAENGDVKVLKFLIDNGSDVNHSTRGGVTALRKACANRQVFAAKLLLGYGADVNNSGPSLPTLLASACTNNSVDIARLLIDNGARVDVDDKGSTPLKRAIDNGNIEMVQLLIEAGADLSLVGSDGVHPILMALMQQHYDIAGLLYLENKNIFSSQDILRKIRHHGLSIDLVAKIMSRPRKLDILRLRYTNSMLHNILVPCVMTCTKIMIPFEQDQRVAVGGRHTPAAGCVSSRSRVIEDHDNAPILLDLEWFHETLTIRYTIIRTVFGYLDRQGGMDT